MIKKKDYNANEKETDNLTLNKKKKEDKKKKETDKKDESIDINEDTNYQQKTKEMKRNNTRKTHKTQHKIGNNCDYDEQSEKRPLEDSYSINRDRNSSLSISHSNIINEISVINTENDDDGKKNKISDFIDLEELKLKCSSSNFLSAHGDIENTPEFMHQLYIDLQMKHPFYISNGEVKKIPLCSKTGCYCCCQSCKKSNIEGLGIGQMIYFKLMKGLILLYFLISLMYIPIYYLNYTNGTDKAPKTYNDYLFRTTIGNIGSTFYNCQSYNYNTVIIDNAMTFKLNCKERKISELIGFGTATNEKEEKSNKKRCFDFLSLNDIDIGQSCDLTKEFDFDKTNCIDKNECSIIKDMTSFTNCNPVDTTKLYFVYSCYEGAISIIDNLFISRNDFGFVIASLDLFTMLAIILALSCIDFKQKKEYKEYRQINTFIRDFTLSLNKIVVKSENLENEIGDLIMHFNKVMSTKEASQYLNYTPNNQIENFKDYHDFISSNNKINNFVLFDIVYPKLTCEKLDAHKKLNKLQKELHKLEIKNGTATIRENSQRELIQNEVIIHQQISMKEKDKKVLKLEGKIEKIKKKINIESNIKEVKEFYLTFRNNRIAKYLNEKYKISKCNRCCLICMCKRSMISLYYYKDNWLKMSYAKDEPSNLKWENMTYSPCKRCLRKTVSIFIAIILMGSTVLVIFFSKTAQAQMADKFNTAVDCSYFEDIPEKEVEEEFTDPNIIDEGEKVKSYCFCSNHMTISDIFTHKLEEISLPMGSKPCKTFIALYIKNSALNLSVILIIPVVNSIVMIIFKALTSCERNKTLSKDMSSNLWKIFIITFINSGLLLVIINLRIDFFIKELPNFPFFSGDFSDFDPGWYDRVGITILFTMALDIVTPHATSALLVILNHITRCCDGGCSGGKKTKSLTKEDYFNIYTGPVFEMHARYASLLSSFFVLMMFSPGLPFLYFCFFLNILITYCVDKILILKFYRNPPKYDLEIINTFLSFCLIAVLIHFPFAIWIYGNPFLLVDKSPNKLIEFKEFIDGLITTDNVILRSIIERVTLGHNLILIVGFLAIIFLLILISVINCVKLMNGKKDKSLHKGLNSTPNVEIGLGISLHDAYKNYIIKEMEYVILKKQPINDQIKSRLENLLEGMLYLKTFIIYKLEKLTNRNYPKLRNNFNIEIRQVKELLTIEKKRLIAEDVSYDILFNPEFEAAAFDDYLKSIELS